MRNLVSTHILALQSSGAGAPEWMHVMPAGTFSGVDGRGPYVLKDASAIIAAFVADGRKLPIDENHSTDLAAKQGFSAPARGWIVELQSRDDGIWAKVEWTPEGQSMMQGKAYGYVSPVFLHPPKPPFTVEKLLRVALTNDPNLNLTSLHSANLETTMDLEALRKALGLPETADEAAILAAVKAAHSASTAHAALLPRVAAVAGVEVTAGADALVSALQAKAKPANATETENADLRNQITSLNSRIETLVNTTGKERAESVIDQAIKDTKIVPALRDHMIARHIKNPAEVETEIKLMPSLNAGGLGDRKIPEGETATTEELSVASMMGVDPEAFKKQHTALFGKGQ
ncbi:phage I-like protein [Agrobacterium larrymoorei]|uniref:Phage I-like protein n=1 Tax=Agrobacterium larrymoorei TaxID=160699 RepID=A0AAJ2BD31_9HYPH|nr:phage protease [Agrobacterium larrymoorei]MDR6102787.1 phage I-like protein [Agrobacterium larrymoorei]